MTNNDKQSFLNSYTVDLPLRHANPLPLSYPTFFFKPRSVCRLGSLSYILKSFAKRDQIEFFLRVYIFRLQSLWISKRFLELMKIIFLY